MRVPLLAAPDVDPGELRSYRLGRLVEGMAEREVDLLVLVSPVSLRYACDWREYPLFQSHIHAFELFVEADGRTTLFGGYGDASGHADEVRSNHAINVFDGGLDLAASAAALADDALAVAGPGGRVAVEAVNPGVVAALSARGLDIVDAQPLVEVARSVKAPVEITCLRHSIAVAEAAMAVMATELRPGLTENELYAVLHHVNVANDGDWIEGRMLSSGPRTNPWYQPASDRVIEVGDLVAFDTDMVGPFGYTADISRTWLVGDTPTADQRDRYRRAHDEITHNAGLLKVGRSFRELSELSLRQPDDFVAHRYDCLAHGVGLTDEYPKIRYPQDWRDDGGNGGDGGDGELVAGMVLSVESFVGSEHGGPGVKLEDMYLLDEHGVERLSTFPFDHGLLGGSA